MSRESTPKPPKKAPPPPQGAAKKPASEGFGFDIPNPLDALNDLLSGKVFEAPEELAQEAETATPEVTEPKSEPANERPSQPVVINNIVKSSKPKPGATGDGGTKTPAAAKPGETGTGTPAEKP